MSSKLPPQSLRFVSLAVVFLSLSLSSRDAWADWTGGNWNGTTWGTYNDTGNWAGGVVNGQIVASGALPGWSSGISTPSSAAAGSYTVKFGGNITTSGNLVIQYNNANDFYLAQDASSETLTLNGNLVFSPGVSNRQGLYLGLQNYQTSYSQITIDLGGGTRVFNLQPSLALGTMGNSSLVGDITDGNLILKGADSLNWTNNATKTNSGFTGTMTILNNGLNYGENGGAGKDMLTPAAINIGYSSSYANGGGPMLTLLSPSIYNSTTAINLGGGGLALNLSATGTVVAGSLNLTGGHSFIADLRNYADVVDFANFSRQNYGTVVMGGWATSSSTAANLGGGVNAQPTFSVYVANGSQVSSQLIGGSGAAGSANMSILPWAVYNADSTLYGGVTTGGSAGGFLTLYNAGGGAVGFRPLNLTTEYNNTTYVNASSWGAQDNVRLSVGGKTTLVANQTINSLFVQGYSALPVLDLGTGTLTVTSGGIIAGNPQSGFTSAAGLTIQNGTLNFGANTGYFFGTYVNAENPSISANIAGTGGFVDALSGNDFLDLSGNNSGLYGSIVVQGGMRIDSTTAIHNWNDIVLQGGNGINYGNNARDYGGTLQLNASGAVSAKSVSGVGKLSFNSTSQILNLGNSVVNARGGQITVGNGSSISVGDASGGLQQAGAILLGLNIASVEINSGGTLALNLQSADMFSQLFGYSGTFNGITFDSGSNLQINLLNGYAPTLGSTWQVLSRVNTTTSVFVSGMPVTDNGMIVQSSNEDTFALNSSGLLTLTSVTPANAWFNGAGTDLATATNFDTTATSGVTVGGAPGSTTNVYFSANRNAGTTSSVSAPLSVNSLRFGAGTSGTQSGMTLSASGTGTLTIMAAAVNGNTAGNGITVATGGGNNTISAPVVLGASQAWTVTDSTSTLTVGGQVSDGSHNYALTKAGAGVLALSGSNTYGGGTTVSAGTLRLDNASGSATGSGSLAVNGGATLAGRGSSAGTTFAISGTSSANRAKVLVGQNYAGDTNTTASMSLTAVTGTISNADLQFNLNSASPGQGNVLDVGATSLTFGNTVFTLNVQGAEFIPSNSAYVLIEGTGVTTGLPTTVGQGNVVTGGQFGGLTVFYNSQGLAEIVGSSLGGGGLLSLQYGSAAWNTDYGSGSYLFIGQVGGKEAIEVAVVPEPGTWALMLGGLGILLFWQRRSRK